MKITLIDVSEEVLLVDDLGILFRLDDFFGHFLEVGIFLLGFFGFLIMEFGLGGFDFFIDLVETFKDIFIDFFVGFTELLFVLILGSFLSVFLGFGSVDILFAVGHEVSFLYI